MKRKLEELNLLDDFLFGTIMSHPLYGKRFDRMVYTVRNHCVEEPDMKYEDGALNLFLYTEERAASSRRN